MSLFGSAPSLIPSRPPVIDSALVGRTLSLAGANAEGSAQFRANAEDFELAESGTLTVNSVGADNSIQGRVDITFPNAAPVRGTFSAKWLPNQVFCN